MRVRMKSAICSSSVAPVGAACRSDARAALAQASAEGDGTQELEQITDFIVTRTS